MFSPEAGSSLYRMDPPGICTWYECIGTVRYNICADKIWPNEISQKFEERNFGKIRGARKFFKNEGLEVLQKFGHRNFTEMLPCFLLNVFKYLQFYF